MLNANSSRSKWSMVVLTLAMIAAFSVSIYGQDAPAVRVGNTEIKGYPDDWTHHHVVFANAGTEQEAIQSGHHEEWLRVVNDPRYVIQQLKKNLPVQGPAAVDAHYRQKWMSEAAPRTSGRVFAPTAAMLRGNFAGHIGRPGPGPVKMSGPKVTKDWSMSLAGAGTAAMGANQYPAKYSFSTDTANCSDFVVYPTGTAGAAAQATIVAYTNIYVGGGCGATNPTFYFSYNTGTGQTATLSPVLSLDGTQTAFIETNGTTANLVVLKMSASGGTVATPTFGAGGGSVTAAAYRTCTAPCYVALPFNGATNDTTSAPFYDYFGDVLYVGDASGNLHKFTNIFKTGTPTELTGGGAASGWPQNMAAGVALTGPVFDQTSGNVFVGSNGGIVYRIPGGGGAATGGGSSNKVASGQIGLATGSDFSDAPLLDSTPATPVLYVFEGDDAAGNGGVTQLSTTFAANNTGTTVTLGSAATTTIQYAGTFDNLHYLGDGTTGNLYICGYHATGADPRLFQVAFPFTTGSGVANTTTDPANGAGTCSPVSEFLGSKANTTLSAAISTVPTSTTLVEPINHTTNPTATTLSTTVTAASTSVTLASVANVVVGDYILIGTEDMLITSRNAVTRVCNVTRGTNGTTAAAHTAGVGVTILSTLATVPTGAGITAGQSIQVDSEFMAVTAVNPTTGVGSTLTVTRGVDGSTAATHATGAGVTVLSQASVASATGIVAGDFLQVDTDIMQVASVAGTTVTVAQGALGTNAATHLSGAAVQDIQDWAYLSVSAAGAATGCTGACLYNYSITTGNIPANSTDGIAATGGTSGIIIDNSATTAGASQIYYTTRGAATCLGNGTTGAGTHGCAIQASQSAP